MTAAVNEYREEQDIVGRFVNECCVIGPAYFSKASVIYAAFRKWCETSGERSIPTSTAFGKELGKHYKKRPSNCTLYEGIAVRSPQAETPTGHASDDHGEAWEG